MNEFQYQTKLAELIEPLSPEETSRFNTKYGNSKKDPIIALVISLTFGFFGVDRFYLGDIILGIIKLITLGGLIIWSIVDLFIIMGKTRSQNLDVAQKIIDSLVDSRIQT
tara:strand:- start:163 stop:492 length:330 start_codon:yes stop_codon:yes gene_type:complete